MDQLRNLEDKDKCSLLISLRKTHRGRENCSNCKECTFPYNVWFDREHSDLGENSILL